MLTGRIAWKAGAAAGAIALVSLTGPGAAYPGQEPAEGPLATEIGANAYRTHCAVCHGRDGTGDGPLARQLRFVPPDLTRLSRLGNGQFPFGEVVRIVEGREPVKGHGGPDMPVWGDAFLDSREGYSKERVREKIEQVVRYLETLQKR